MPQPEYTHLYDRAVLWPAVGSDVHGQPAVGTPQEVACRWNDVFTEMLDPQRISKTYDGNIVVTLDVPVGSHMWKGTLDGWYASGSAGQEGVVEVKAFNATRDLRGRATFRTLGFLRLHV